MLDRNIPSVDPRGALLRIVWMAALPFILLSAFLIADVERWTFGTRDVALAVLVIVAVAARAADTLLFDGTTAEGDPSTRAHVMRYARRVTAVAAGAWLVAQSVAI